MNAIVSGLSKSNSDKVIQCEATKEMLEKLQSIYEGDDINSTYKMKTKKMSQKEEVLKYSNKIKYHDY